MEGTKDQVVNISFMFSSPWITFAPLFLQKKGKYLGFFSYYCTMQVVVTRVMDNLLLELMVVSRDDETLNEGEVTHGEILKFADGWSRLCSYC